MKKKIFALIFIGSLWIPGIIGVLHMLFASPGSTLSSIFYIVAGFGLAVLTPITSVLLFKSGMSKNKLLGIVLTLANWSPGFLLVALNTFLPNGFDGLLSIIIFAIWGIGILTLSPLATIRLFRLE